MPIFYLINTGERCLGLRYYSPSFGFQVLFLILKIFPTYIRSESTYLFTQACVFELHQYGDGVVSSTVVGMNKL